MSPLTLVLFIAGIVLLISGAELLVRGASRLAVAVGITPLVVGLTVVAFGTGSPELAVGIQAGAAGQADITIGNVVGSNIFNVLLILGISATVAPLVVSQQLVRLDVPIMIIVSVAFLLMSLDGVVDRGDGAVLVTASVLYTYMLVRISRRETAAVHAEYEGAYGSAPSRDQGRWPVHALLVLLGLALLVVGSRWLVDGAVSIAGALGVSELIIGLTIIAAGTSLPEVATSIVAGLRGERDIAVGNVVGSNLFNILVVVGVTAAVTPGGLRVAPAAINFDMPVMIAASVLCLPIFFVRYRIGRWEGALFLSYYIFYTLYLILAASQHDALPAFSAIMSRIVIPLTVGTVALVFGREVLRRYRLRGTDRPA
ncbi:MAG TPA: calcium/sodium antiporter [Longimicrobiales bacterium]|nr:calcium/sodium antiporter [Longimicrobiales bacterium]